MQGNTCAQIMYLDFEMKRLSLDYPKHYGWALYWLWYSPILNPLDFFLSSHLKDKVYHSNIKVLEVLKMCIQHYILDIATDIIIQSNDTSVCYRITKPLRFISKSYAMLSRKFYFIFF